jgi:CheY-like chemotaxis protein
LKKQAGSPVVAPAEMASKIDLIAQRHGEIPKYKSAFHHYKTIGADVIFMDMSMLVMDGLTATRELRTFKRQRGLSPVPIVALTANAVDNDGDACEAAGTTIFCASHYESKNYWRNWNFVWQRKSHQYQSSKPNGCLAEHFTGVAQYVH